MRDVCIRKKNQFKHFLRKDVTQTSINSSAGVYIGTDDQDIRVRKYGEVVYNTLSSVASVLEYPKGFCTIFFIPKSKLQPILFVYYLDLIKDSARPSYWVPDVEANNCCVCAKRFGTAEELVSNSKQQSPYRSSHSLPSVADSSDSTGLQPAVSDRKRHHCRACGQAVCDNCSQGRRPVPERGS